MLETDLEKHLGRSVKKMNGISFKWVSPGRAGVPDRVVLLPKGKIYFIELKVSGKKARPLQEYWLGVLRKLGFDARVLSNRNEVDLFLKEVAGWNTARTSTKSTQLEEF